MDVLAFDTMGSQYFAGLEERASDECSPASTRTAREHEVLRTEVRSYGTRPHAPLGTEHCYGFADGLAVLGFYIIGATILYLGSAFCDGGD